MNLSGSDAHLDLGEHADLLDGEVVLGEAPSGGGLGPWQLVVVSHSTPGAG